MLLPAPLLTSIATTSGERRLSSIFLNQLPLSINLIHDLEYLTITIAAFSLLITMLLLVAIRLFTVVRIGALVVFKSRLGYQDHRIVIWIVELG